MSLVLQAEEGLGRLVLAKQKAVFFIQKEKYKKPVGIFLENHLILS